MGGATVDSPIADPAGMIKFSYSTWPEGVFTVVEDVSFVPISMSTGNGSGVVLNVNQTPVSGANVSMYTAGDTFVKSVLSGVDGRFSFSNVSNGSYYVVAHLPPCGFNRSQEFNIAANSITNIGNLTILDLDYVNVCDAVYWSQYIFG